jgi:hypothetical protein
MIMAEHVKGDLHHLHFFYQQSLLLNKTKPLKDLATDKMEMSPATR